MIGRYPVPRSATIPLLHLAQSQDGHVTQDAMAHIAELVGSTPAEVYGVASFYEMFKEHPVGRYLLGVCTNLSCMILGADEILGEHVTRRSSASRPVGPRRMACSRVEEMQCLAACGGAPCMQVNYRYFEDVTPASVDTILDDLRHGRPPLGQDVPDHGTLSSVKLPKPVTATDRVRPEVIHTQGAVES